MRVLMGDRFLKMFAGDLKRRWNRAASKTEDQEPQAEDEMGVGPDSALSEQAAADSKDAPDGEE